MAGQSHSLTSDTGQSQQPARGLNDLTALLDFAAGSHRRAAAMLLILALTMFLPGFFQISPVDRDEARFAQATKQMVETGDYIDIRFQDEVRYKKPVGIYWMQAAVVNVAEAVGVPRARTTIWLYRLPSLLGAAGAVLLTYWTALAFVSRRSAIIAAAMMATSIILGVEARLAKTDAMLLLTCVAAMGAMARIYLAAKRAPDFSPGWKHPAIFWTAVAVGMLLKGPLIFLFAGLPALILSVIDRSARWLSKLRPLSGLIWFALLVLPWFVSIMLRSGNTFLTEALGQDMLAKITSSQETHGAPPGYYFILFWVTFWPGAVLTAIAAPAIWRARREPGARFLLAWLIPSWIVFELVVTKLPHYVLPLLPAVAILIAGVVERDDLSRARWLVRGTFGWFLLPGILAILSIAAFIWLARDLGFVVWPFAAGAAIAGLFAWWLYDADGPERALLRAMASSLLLMISVFGIVLPSLPMLFPSDILASIVRSAGCDKPLVAAAGFHEPSLVFLAGTDTRLVEGTAAADFLRQGPCRIAIIEGRSERSFVQRAEVIGLRYQPLPRVDGFNISSGRSVSLSVFSSGR